jgi:hypothetical protein
MKLIILCSIIAIIREQNIISIFMTALIYNTHIILTNMFYSYNYT